MTVALLSERTTEHDATNRAHERRLFGTDGVRGIANQHPMTCEVALALGRAMAYQAREKGARQRVIIGKDPRLSGYMLEMAVASGVCSMGRVGATKPTCRCPKRVYNCSYVLTLPTTPLPGSRGMAEVTLDSVWQATDYAGVRDLTSDAGNFGWAVDGSGKSLVRVATNGGAGPLVEIAVPFTSVFGPAGLPEGGAHLAVFVRLVSASGNDLSNQSLPADDAAHPNTVSQVAIIDVQ